MPIPTRRTQTQPAARHQPHALGSSASAQSKVLKARQKPRGEWPECRWASRVLAQRSGRQPLPEGQEDVELPGTHFVGVSNFLRARPEAPVGRAASPAPPRPLLGDRRPCGASASPQHPPRVQPLPQRCCQGGQGDPPQAPLLWAPTVPAPLPFPSHPFLRVFLIFLPSVLLGSLPGYFQQWLSLPAREGMND